LKAHGIEATATPGQRSQFDVLADEELVFSKQEVDRFPDDGEILSLLTA
jgi:hypothetical protein